jgi:hypothetical protein
MNFTLDFAKTRRQEVVNDLMLGECDRDRNELAETSRFERVNRGHGPFASHVMDDGRKGDRRFRRKLARFGETRRFVTNIVVLRVNSTIRRTMFEILL